MPFSTHTHTCSAMETTPQCNPSDVQSRRSRLEKAQARAASKQLQ